MVLAPPWGVLPDRDRHAITAPPGPPNAPERTPTRMTPDPLTPVRPPLARLSAALVVVCVVAAGVGGLVSGSVRDGLLSLGATLPGVVISTLLLTVRPAQPAARWGVPVLAGTMVRALVTLGVAYAMAESMDADRKTLMLTALGALLGCLVVEVGAVLSMLNARGSHAASLEGARS